MDLGPEYRPDYVSLKDKLLELAQIRKLDDLLDQVAKMLAERPHIALARIWLLDRGDRCASCPYCNDCSNKESCLHLAASAGLPANDALQDWNRLDGEFSRIPLGGGKIGRVGQRGEGITVKDFRECNQGSLANYTWASRQHIRGFNAQPIKFKGEVLGVAAVFTVIPLPEESPAWLRIFADHIASAIINARAFEQIVRLKAKLETQNRYLEEEVREARCLGEMVGEHPVVRELQAQVEMVAPTDVSVLILGESGTGKELVAREIYRLSLRRDRPLIRVNCASVPRELYESEFFGHVKGSFTGAIRDRSGRFEAADGGTLFLDEVGEIPLQLQSKFLRVLQEKQYERVGEERTRTVNVRIIAATNRDLKKEVEAGRFREDLFYRLNVFPLQVPPLRDRRTDIPILAKHFLAQAAQRLRLPIPQLTPARISLLQKYDWPGNVRELQNAVERALILARRGGLQFDVPVRHGTGPPVFCVAGQSAGEQSPDCETILTEPELHDLERRNLIAALVRARWKIHGEGGAAELLQVKPTTLISRIKKLGLKKSEVLQR